MKKYILFFALLPSLSAFSQNSCEKTIHYEYSSFDGEHRFFTPKEDEKKRDEPIYFEKALSKGETKYFVHIKVYYPTFYTALVDLSIQFADGSKILRRQQLIGVKPSKITNFYESTTLFRINESELNLLLSKRIGGFRIQTDEFKIPAEEGVQLKHEVECLRYAQVPK